MGLVLAAAAGLAAAASAPSEPRPGELQLAWLDAAGRLRTAVLTEPAAARAAPPSGRQPAVPGDIPLGSLWKLVAYARLVDAGAREAPYVCRGQAADEVYCCEPGQRVDRGTALWKSCGLYFDPRRVGLGDLPPGATAQALPDALAPLRQPDALGPQTRVPLAAWLQWLARWPVATRRQAADDLSGYWLRGPGQPQLAAVGSRLHLKTFTVERREAAGAGQRWAGASGWLDDGTPLWFAARGSSRQVVPRWAPAVLAHLEADDLRDAVQSPDADGPVGSPRVPGSVLGAGPCIQVRFFSRYPVRSVSPAPSADGVLPAGRYRLRFVNGNGLDIVSAGELRAERGPAAFPAGSQAASSGDVPAASGPWRLSGSFPLEDYVARVIDREGQSRPAAAAQALAVAARTYVLRHARSAGSGACLDIDDSSATQRVAPRPPSAGARAAAAHTAGLVLAGSGPGAEGRHHASQSAPGRLAWRDAVQAAETGLGFDAILRGAYPQAALATLAGGASACEPLPLAEQWLAARRPSWQRRLAGEAGYTPPPAVQVCRLQQGRPYAARAAGRIFVTGSQSLEERLALTHEYLHLAFSGHPRGRDEDFIERQARRLLGVD